MLTADRLREVLNFDPDTGQFTWCKSLSLRGRVGERAGHSQKDGRVIVGIDGVSYLAHRLAWLYTHGAWPLNLIDHINRDNSDNRLVNLRQATSSENKLNADAHRDSVTGLKGITFDRSRARWVVQLSKKGRKSIAKRFVSKAEAIEFYRQKSVEYHGEFAPLDVLARMAA